MTDMTLQQEMLLPHNATHPSLIQDLSESEGLEFYSGL